MIQAVIATIISTIIVVGAVVYYASQPPKNDLVGQSYEDQGATHIAQNELHPDYNSNPPSSGWHYTEPAAWGFYDRELSDEQVVHNLEHGGVWLAYQANIDQSTQETIKLLVARFSSKVIATQRSKNDTPIALVSWGRVLKMETFDKDAALDFIRRNKNHGPEQIPD